MNTPSVSGFPKSRLVIVVLVLLVASLLAVSLLSGRGSARLDL